MEEDELPAFISLEILLEKNGSSSIRKSSVEFRHREQELFLSGADTIIFRGHSYRKDTHYGSDIARLDSNGVPYRKLNYYKGGKE